VYPLEPEPGVYSYRRGWLAPEPPLGWEPELSWRYQLPPSEQVRLLQGHWPKFMLAGPTFGYWGYSAQPFYYGAGWVPWSAVPLRWGSCPLGEGGYFLLRTPSAYLRWGSVRVWQSRGILP